MAHLPLFKLGVLLVKQATKPMMRAIKSRAQSSQSVARVCEFFGQQWHVQTTKINLMVQGHRVKGVKPLNEQEAVQSGAELIAEGFVLSVGISALVIESRRSAAANAKKAAQKELRQHQKMEAMQHLNDTIRELAWFTVELRNALEKAEQERMKHDRSRRNLPPIILPSIPVSVQEMIDGGSSPTDVVVALHNKDQETTDGRWGLGLVKRLTFDTTVGVIKWVGSVVNGEDDDDDDGPSLDDGDEE